MNTHNPICTAATTTTQPQNPLLKLALDVHADTIVAAPMWDAVLKPPRRFSPGGLLEWVQHQQAAGWRMVSCYEAGPFGYTLHRQLTALGVTNLVIRPRDWDSEHKRVKTDGTDACAMLVALDRYLAGQQHALCVVHVPTETQERLRAQSRLRDQLVRQKKHLAQRGRGLALQFGYRLKGRWFGPRNWPRWQQQLPDWLQALLEALRPSLDTLHQQVRVLTEQIEAVAVVDRPIGLGTLTAEILRREVGDWNRFHNRRQVASYTGLVPSEHSSGPTRYQGRVTKCGNPRLRWALCEAAWRLVRYQPEYRLVKKWKPRILDPHTSRGKRKQALVALARGFAIDWWRLQTAQTTAEKLGLKLTTNTGRSGVACVRAPGVMNPASFRGDCPLG